MRARLKEQQTKSHMSLDDLFNRIEEGTTELNLVVKADVQGSIEELRDAFEKMDQSEVKIQIIHSAVGGVTETDAWPPRPTQSSSASTCARPQVRVRLPSMRRSTFVCIALSTRRLKTSTQLVSVCWRLNSSTKTPVLPRSATCSAFRRSAILPAATSPRAKSPAMTRCALFVTQGYL